MFEYVDIDQAKAEFEKELAVFINDADKTQDVIAICNLFDIAVYNNLKEIADGSLDEGTINKQSRAIRRMAEAIQALAILSDSRAEDDQ